MTTVHTHKTYRQNVDGLVELAILLVVDVVIGVVHQGRQLFVPSHVTQLHLTT